MNSIPANLKVVANLVKGHQPLLVKVKRGHAMTSIKVNVNVNRFIKRHICIYSDTLFIATKKVKRSLKSYLKRFYPVF